MMKRNNNQLPNNIPQLQNLIKRDPSSYKDEFQQQYHHYKSLLRVFLLNPTQLHKNLDELVIFIAQVSHCYPDTLKDFAQEIINLLETQNAVLESTIRMSFCKALILLRNKNLLPPTDLLSLFFKLLRCNDKALRVLLQSHIVSDIKNLNSKHKNIKLNTVLQNFMFNMLKDSNPKAVKLSLDIMVELFKKDVWNDTKAVNVIASACFSKDTKVVVTALKFFLSTNDSTKDKDESDSEDEPNTKEVAMANKVNKKTRKREKQLKKVKQLVQKTKKKKLAAPAFSFSALHQVHDPQGFAEKLFHNLESTHERFEVRLMTLDVVSRLIGLHQLIILNFYPYIQKFLQPHQKDVTKLLLYTAQACHELIPPDVLEPVLRTLVNNFVTERNSSDVMAIGLNAVREMCSRCPLAMNEDLLQDLAQYKTHRERSVMMAARSLIQLYRHSMPSLLHKKDRGRPTEAAIEYKEKKFGETTATDYVPGAEALVHNNEGNSVNVKEAIELKRKEATEVSVTQLLTDEDFKVIENALISKQIEAPKRGMKRKLEEPQTMKETVCIEDIENIFKKKKNDKHSRVESVKRGQEGREKFGYKDGRLNPFSSKTNREKRKNKNFMMIKHKVRGKSKRSFKDKQVALRNYLIQQKKMR